MSATRRLAALLEVLRVQEIAQKVRPNSDDASKQRDPVTADDADRR